MMLGDCPYIKDGLVFWLDGILKGTDSSKWIDRIGKREFLLNDCSFADDGVVFNGSTSTSGGIYNGRIDVDWDKGTIECAANVISNSQTILCPGNGDEHSNIGFIRGANDNAGYRCDGQNAKRASVPKPSKTVSLSSQHAIADLVIRAYGSNDYWAIPYTRIKEPCTQSEFITAY